MGELDARSFRESIWRHRPITDIWNIGPGIARRLAKYRVFDLKLGPMPTVAGMPVSARTAERRVSANSRAVRSYSSR